MKKRSHIKYSLEKRLQICILYWGILLAATIMELTYLLFSANQTDIPIRNLTWRSLLFLLLYIVGFLLVYRFYTIPAQKVKTVLKNFNKGLIFDEIFSLPYEINDDLDIVFAKFEALLNKKEILEKSLEQSKYLALQNQINPHFLYNTLDAIRGDALMAGLENISDTIEALSTYFAYSISNLEQYATVMEELLNVQDYITVQKYRFGEELGFKIEYDEEPEYYKSLFMPRFVLQPVVENAIYHGLEVRNKRGNIKIRLECTKTRLNIDVIDDGVGMPYHILESLNQKLVQAVAGLGNAGQRKKGIALVNVNSRIKLLFGDEYGMYVYSTEGVGTDVKITLPIVFTSDQK